MADDTKGRTDVDQLTGILAQFRDEDIVAAIVKKGIRLYREGGPMEKQELVKTIAGKLKIETGVAEQAVNDVIVELVSPYVLRRPGEEVAFLDNNCNNSCRPVDVTPITERRAAR